MLPTFFTNGNKADGLVIIANMGERQSWGQEAFWLKDNAIKSLGWLDVAVRDWKTVDDSTYQFRTRIRTTRTSRPIRWARSSARSLLPEAVAPTTATIGGRADIPRVSQPHPLGRLKSAVEAGLVEGGRKDGASVRRERTTAMTTTPDPNEPLPPGDPIPTPDPGSEPPAPPDDPIPSDPVPGNPDPTVVPSGDPQPSPEVRP
jgi:hypothetical protein